MNIDPLKRTIATLAAETDRGGTPMPLITDPAFGPETKGEFIVILRLGSGARVQLQQIHATFGDANREALAAAKRNPGTEVSVYQMRQTYALRDEGGAA